MLDQVRSFREQRVKDFPIRVLYSFGKLLGDNPDINKVYLIGSYANGTWVDSNTPEWFKKHRKSIGMMKEYSDVDFYTEPLVKSTKDYDIVPILKKNAILIYDNTN